MSKIAAKRDLVRNRGRRSTRSSASATRRGDRRDARDRDERDHDPADDPADHDVLLPAVDAGAPRGAAGCSSAMMPPRWPPTRDSPSRRARRARHPAGGSATARRSRGSTRRRPRRATSSRSRSATGCSSAAARCQRPAAATFATIDPATEQPLAAVASATPVDVDKAVRAARRAQRRSWGPALRPRAGQVPVPDLAHPPGAQSREFAVLESMDSGKPIKESRDVDVPLAAAHFWYYAGWADKLEYAFPGRVARPLGVAAQIIPWNFPLLMLAWKIAPALAAGNTVVLKPASTTPLSALLFADVCRQADLPPGRRQHRHRARARSAWRWSPTRTSTRSRSPARPRSASKICRGRGRHRQGADARARRQGRQHRVRRRAARPGGRGHRQRHLLQPGRGLLRRLAAARPGVDRRDRSSTSSRTACRRSASATRSTRTPTSGPSTRRASSRRSPSSSRPAWPRAPTCTSRPATCPSAATSSGPTLFTNVAQSHRIAREEIFGPVLSVLTFRTPDEAVEKANNTALRPVGRESGPTRARASSRWSREMQGRRRLGQHVQPVRPDVAVRRLQGVGLRARGRHARPARLRPARGPLTVAARTRPGLAGRARSRRGRDDRRSGPAHRGPQDLQAVHRRRVPADRERPLVPGHGRRRHAARQRLPGVAQGPARRGPGRPRRRSRAGPAKTAMNRGQVLYRVAELMEGRRDQFVAEVAAAEGLRDARAREVVDRAIDRWVWYAGWADKIAQVLGSSNPVAAPYFNFTIPEPTGVVGVVAPETSSLLGLVSRLAPPLVAGNAVVLLTSRDAAAAGGHADRGARDVGRARRRRQRPDRAQDGARAGPGRPRRRRCARHVGRARRHADRDRAPRRRRHQAPVAPADHRVRGPVRLARRPRRRAPRMDRRLPRDEDGLAPDRGCSGWPSAPIRRSATGVPATTAAADGARRAPGLRPGPAPGRLGDAPRSRRAGLSCSRSCGSVRPRRRGRPLPRPGRRGPGSGFCARRPGSRASRPARSRVFRLRVTGSGFESEWSWRLEPVAGGTRVVHAATFEPYRPLDGHPRPARPGVAEQPGRGAPAGAQGTRGGDRALDPPGVSAEPID